MINQRAKTNHPFAAALDKSSFGNGNASRRVGYLMHLSKISYEMSKLPRGDWSRSRSPSPAANTPLPHIRFRIPVDFLHSPIPNDILCCIESQLPGRLFHSSQDITRTPDLFILHAVCTFTTHLLASFDEPRGLRLQIPIKM